MKSRSESIGVVLSANRTADGVQTKHFFDDVGGVDEAVEFSRLRAEELV